MVPRGTHLEAAIEEALAAGAHVDHFNAAPWRFLDLAIEHDADPRIDPWRDAFARLGAHSSVLTPAARLELYVALLQVLGFASNPEDARSRARDVLDTAAREVTTRLINDAASAAEADTGWLGRGGYWTAATVLHTELLAEGLYELARALPNDEGLRSAFSDRYHEWRDATDRRGGFGVPLRHKIARQEWSQVVRPVHDELIATDHLRDVDDIKDVRLTGAIVGLTELLSLVQWRLGPGLTRVETDGERLRQLEEFVASRSAWPLPYEFEDAGLRRHLRWMRRHAPPHQADATTPAWAQHYGFTEWRDHRWRRP